MIVGAHLREKRQTLPERARQQLEDRHIRSLERLIHGSQLEDERDAPGMNGAAGPLLDRDLQQAEECRRAVDAGAHAAQDALRLASAADAQLRALKAQNQAQNQTDLAIMQVWSLPRPT